MTSAEVMEREYLEMRALILRLAASLDRIDRSSSPQADATKRQQLIDGLNILLENGGGRAEKVQHLFSNGYQDDWANQFGLNLHR